MRCLLVGLFLLAVPARALGQGDLDLVSSVVPPNVMLLLDNSGSMSHAMWADDFDPLVFQDTGSVRTSCDIGAVPAQLGSDGFCVGSGDALDRCPDNGNSLQSGTEIRCAAAGIGGGCAAAPAAWSCSPTGSEVRFTLPEFTPGSVRTRWSTNYLSWLFQEIIDGSTPTIPMTDRLETSRNALLQLIDLINPDGFNESVRFGLTKFDSGATPMGASSLLPYRRGTRTRSSPA